MKIADLVENTKDIEFRPVAERAGSVVAYRRALIAVLREIKQETDSAVLPAYKASLITDRESWFASMKRRAEMAVQAAIDKVASIFFDEANSHMIRFAASVKTGTGLDVAPILNLSQREIDDLVLIYVERNASLIKSLSDDMVKRVEQAVYDAKLNRRNYKDLTAELQKQFGIAKNRADLIAYDQLASLNSDFTESRHNAIGIKEYRWRIRQDGRTRPLHRQISGNIYEWGQPTGAEGGLPPGKNIMCRCTAVAILPANPEAVKRQEQREAQIARSNAIATRRDRSTPRRRAVSRTGA